MGLVFFFLPDLIPKENLEKWLNYLNNELPTIAFKSAMQPKDRNKVRIPPEVLKVKQKMAKALLEMKGLGWGPKAGVFWRVTYIFFSKKAVAIICCFLIGWPKGT